MDINVVLTEEQENKIRDTIEDILVSHASEVQALDALSDDDLRKSRMDILTQQMVNELIGHFAESDDKTIYRYLLFHSDTTEVKP